MGQRQLLTNTAARALSGVGLWCTMLAVPRLLRSANGLLPCYPADRRAGQVHQEAACAAQACHLSDAAAQGIDSSPLALVSCVHMAKTNAPAQGCALTRAPAPGGCIPRLATSLLGAVRQCANATAAPLTPHVSGAKDLTGKMCVGTATT